MTTINRDRDNAGTCHTVGAGPLLTSAEVFAQVNEYRTDEITDECAATIASWWHSSSGDGAVFSRLSHRIDGGVLVEDLHRVIYNAQRELDTQRWDPEVSDNPFPGARFPRYLGSQRSRIRVAFLTRVS